MPGSGSALFNTVVLDPDPADPQLCLDPDPHYSLVLDPYPVDQQP
jgi:hypothetical protein